MICTCTILSQNPCVINKKWKKTITTEQKWTKRSLRVTSYNLLHDYRIVVCVSLSQIMGLFIHTYWTKSFLDPDAWIWTSQLGSLNESDVERERERERDDLKRRGRSWNWYSLDEYSHPLVKLSERKRTSQNDTNSRQEGRWHTQIIGKNKMSIASHVVRNTLSSNSGHPDEEFYLGLPGW